VANITTAALTGLLAVMGTIGAAYLTGHFDLHKTETQNTGTIDLEKLKFANDLVKGALAAQNPANSLKFYADIGLLNSLNVEAVRQYAKNENERLKSGSSTDSVLPDLEGYLIPSYGWTKISLNPSLPRRLAMSCSP
jgi:hypothetical protein